MMGLKKRSFTLIELLVVLAVISLLMALLLPALGRAKEIGRRTLCMSNLKQCGLALTMYANEYGRYPHQRNPTSGFYYDDTQTVHAPPQAQLAGEWGAVVEYAVGSPFTFTDATGSDPTGKLKIFECPDRPLPVQDFSSPNDGSGFVFVMSYFYVAGTVTNWWGADQGYGTSANRGPPTYSPRSPDDPPDWAVMVDQIWGNAGQYDPAHPEAFYGSGRYKPAGLNELYNDGHVAWVNWNNGQNTLPIANWFSEAYWGRRVDQP